MSIEGADIVGVVNLHNEGDSATASLVSAWRAIEVARIKGLDAHLAIVLDSADDQTLRTALRWQEKYGTYLMTTNAGDLGLARNAAAKSFDTKWLAFLDGDDLWGVDWLVAAHDAVLESSAGLRDVFHPQVNIIFGDHHSLLHHIDSTNPEFLWSRFCLHNAWTALSFVRRDLLLEMPYPKNDLSNGYGYEDWSWNMAVLDAGGRHRVVEDTVHFIKRTNGDSLLGQSRQALRTRYPSAIKQATRPEDESSTPTTAEVDAGTHSTAPVELSPAVFRQIRMATTIEPDVAKTLTAAGTPSSLPQNFNTHNTAPQFALEELWALRTDSATIGEICDQSRLLSPLHVDDRVKVVAEFLLTERAVGRPVGESVLITEAIGALPQLASRT